jgi:hypothetical protein
MTTRICFLFTAFACFSLVAGCTTDPTPKLTPEQISEIKAPVSPEQMQNAIQQRVDSNMKTHPDYFYNGHYVGPPGPDRNAMIAFYSKKSGVPAAPPTGQ